MSPRAAAFLDRDGTILDELGYLGVADELKLLPGAAEAIRSMNAAGLLVVVITNQSGIARGLLTEEDLTAVHRRMAQALGAHGAHLDDVLFCPHHPSEGAPPYRRTCECRKPAPGLIRRAMDRHGIDPRTSVVIGDAARDLESGRRAGVGRLILVNTGQGAATWEAMSQDERADVERAPDLLAAARAILA